MILVENLPVPFDRRVWMEATTLHQAGFHVSVISPREPGDKPIDVIEGVHVYRYRMPPPTRGVLSFVYEFVYCWIMTFWLSLVVWKREGFDVIHACNPPDTFWIIGRFYKLFGKRYVFDHHDINPEIYEERFRRKGWVYNVLLWLERRQFATADRVISTNESYREIAITRGRCNPDIVTVVRSGPDLSRFTRRAPNPAYRNGRRYLVVYLGVIGPQDGLDYLLRSVNHIARELERDDIQFLIVGGGDWLPDIQRMCASLELNDRVQFTGFLTGDALLEALSTADAAVVPDPRNPLNDNSTKNKVIEYMALGIPMVTFDLKETRYSAGDYAVYVTPNNEIEFAEKLVDLLDDPERREWIARGGIERVRERLAWCYSRKKLIDLYCDLLNVAAPAESTANRPVEQVGAL